MRRLKHCQYKQSDCQVVSTSDLPDLYSQIKEFVCQSQAVTRLAKVLLKWTEAQQRLFLCIRPVPARSSDAITLASLIIIAQFRGYSQLLFVY